MKPAPKRVPGRRHEAHDAIERGVQQKAGEHCRHRGRRLAVRIGQPRMNRCEPGFRAIADQNEDEREFHQRRVKPNVGGSQIGPEQRVHRRRASGLADGLNRRGGKDRSDEREGDPDRADDQVFPHRFERQAARMQRYQEGAQQRRRLHADPHDAEIVGNEDQHHRRERAEPERAKAARDRESEAVLAGFVGEIHAGKDRAEQEHQNQNDQVEGGKGVDVKPLIRRRHQAVAAEDADPHVGGKGKFDRRDRDDRRRERRAAAAAPGRAAPPASPRRALRMIE